MNKNTKRFLLNNEIFKDMNSIQALFMRLRKKYVKENAYCETGFFIGQNNLPSLK